MPKKDNIILNYNHRKNSMKAPYNIYADIDACHSNPKKSSTTKINKHPACGYSLFAHFSFDVTKKT